MSAQVTEDEKDKNDSGSGRTLRWNKAKKDFRSTQLLSREYDKNDPSRFEGSGVSFRAKLIGVEDVAEARGDKMCQEAMQKLKADIKNTKEHKQRICISVSLDGLKITDEKSAVSLHQHAVHRISFISRDVSDARAFGYVYGPGGNAHQFFAIKTEKAAEGLVLTLRDLFQVVFEMKKKEVTNALKNKEILMDASKVKQLEEQGTNGLDGLSSHGNGYSENSYEDPTSSPVSVQSQKDGPLIQGDIAGNLVDLESELVTIQQGLAQIDAFGGVDGGPSWGLGDPWGSGRSQPSSDSSSNAALSASYQGTPPVSHNNTLNSNTQDEDDPFVVRSSPFMLRPAQTKSNSDITSSPRLSHSPRMVERPRPSPATSIDKSTVERPRPSPSSSSGQYSDDAIQRTSSLRGSKRSALQPTSDPFSDDPFFSSSTPTNSQNNTDAPPPHDKFAAFNEISNVTASSAFDTSPPGGMASSSADVFADGESSVFGSNSTMNNADSHDANQAFNEPSANDKFAAFNKSLFNDTPVNGVLERGGTRGSGASNHAWSSAHSSPQLTRANSQPHSSQSAWAVNGATHPAKPVEDFESKFSTARSNTPDPFDSSPFKTRGLSASEVPAATAPNQQTWASFNSAKEDAWAFKTTPQSAPPIQHNSSSPKPDWKTFNFDPNERSSTPESNKGPSPSEPLSDSDPPAPPPRPLSRQDTGEAVPNPPPRVAQSAQPTRGAPPIPHRPPVARASTMDMGMMPNSNSPINDANRQSPVLNPARDCYSPISRQSPMTVIDELENEVGSEPSSNGGIARSRPRPRSKTPNLASQASNTQLSTQSSTSQITSMHWRTLPRQQSMPVTMNLPLSVTGNNKTFTRDSLERQSDKVDDQIAARRVALANAVSTNGGKALVRNQSDSMIDPQMKEDTGSIGSNELQAYPVDLFTDVDPFAPDDTESDPFSGEDPFSKEVTSPTEVFETRAVSLQGPRPCSVPITVSQDPFADDPFADDLFAKQNVINHSTAVRDDMRPSELPAPVKEASPPPKSQTTTTDKSNVTLDAFGKLPEADNSAAEPDPFVVSPSVIRGAMLAPGFSSDSQSPQRANELMGRSQLQPTPVSNTNSPNVSTTSEPSSTPPPLPPKRDDVRFPTTFDTPVTTKTASALVNSFSTNFDTMSPDNSFPVDFDAVGAAASHDGTVAGNDDSAALSVPSSMKRDGFSTDFTPFNDANINPVPSHTSTPPPNSIVKNASPSLPPATEVTSHVVQSNVQPTPPPTVQPNAQPTPPPTTQTVANGLETTKEGTAEPDPFANLNAFTYTFGSKPEFRNSPPLSSGFGTHSSSLPPDQPPPPLPSRTAPPRTESISSATTPAAVQQTPPIPQQTSLPTSQPPSLPPPNIPPPTQPPPTQPPPTQPPPTQPPPTQPPPTQPPPTQLPPTQPTRTQPPPQQPPPQQPPQQQPTQQQPMPAVAHQQHVQPTPSQPHPQQTAYHQPTHPHIQQPAQQPPSQPIANHMIQQQQSIQLNTQQLQQQYQQTAQIEQQLKQQQYEQHLKQQQIEQQLRQLQYDSQIKQQQLEQQLKQQQYQAQMQQQMMQQQQSQQQHQAQAQAQAQAQLAQAASMGGVVPGAVPHGAVQHSGMVQYGNHMVPAAPQMQQHAVQQQHMAQQQQPRSPAPMAVHNTNEDSEC